MRRSLGPLLCELHAHTRWSDGVFTVAELVDLHGRSGFDVLGITDHVVRRDDPWRERIGLGFRSVDAGAWDEYLADVEREAGRAWRTYGLLVIPGLELTFNDENPLHAAHAVALGLRSFVSLDDGIEEAMRMAAEAGAALVAAHPYDGEPAPRSARLTQRFARDDGLRELAHRFELFNRTQLFGWVADAGLPAVATGDFHRPSTYSAGRRCSRVATKRRRWSSTSARGARSTWLGSRPTPHSPPRRREHSAGDIKSPGHSRLRPRPARPFTRSPPSKAPPWSI